MLAAVPAPCGCAPRPQLKLKLPAAASAASMPLTRLTASVWYSRRLRTTPAALPLARSSEPATREAICSPLTVTSGTPAHSASLPGG